MQSGDQTAGSVKVRHGRIRIRTAHIQNIRPFSGICNQKTVDDAHVSVPVPKLTKDQEKSRHIASGRSFCQNAILQGICVLQQLISDAFIICGKHGTGQPL